MSAISQAVERLTLIAKRGGGFSSTMTGKLDAEAATIVLAHLAELEAKQPRAAALERECAAWRAAHEARSAYDAKWMRARLTFGIGSFSEEGALHHTENAARDARAATDATEGK